MQGDTSIGTWIAYSAIVVFLLVAFGMFLRMAVVVLSLLTIGPVTTVLRRLGIQVREAPEPESSRERAHDG